jgi:hypothetical protein
MNRDITTKLTARRGYLWLALIVALPGCNRSSFELAPVHGRVTIDNKPLFQGKVMFAPVAKGNGVNPGKPAWGNIQPDGTFRLTTYKNDDGAIVGEHLVTIMNSDEKLPTGVPAFARLIVPKKATVVANNDNEINFTFAGSDVKKFAEDNH